MILKSRVCRAVKINKASYQISVLLHTSLAFDCGAYMCDCVEHNFLLLFYWSC